MSAEAPHSPGRLRPSKDSTPSWALHWFRRTESSQSRKTTKSTASDEGTSLQVPGPRKGSTASGESRSIRSKSSHGPSSFRGMMNRFRSSSSVGLVPDELPIQEFNFKSIESWFHGFERYNQLVTTRTSLDRLELFEEFSKICSILSKTCGGRFIHGLPEAVFDLALLWCPAEPLKRNETQEPTWSWTGYHGAVNFPFDPTNCPDILSMPRSDGEWFKSEILHYFIGPQSALYTIRREKKDRNLRIQYPPYFHAPQGYDASANSDTLRFTAQTIPADGFSAEQLEYEGKSIPCSQLLNEKGQHCGVIMDFEDSISSPSSNGPYEFVLVSRNRRREPATHTRRPTIPTIHPPGTPVWDGKSFLWDQEVVDFDPEVYEEGPWKVLNVILIKWVGEHAERVAVARIHEDDWLQRTSIKKDIVLR